MMASLTFLHMLHTDLEWKVIYVGSAEDSQHDQILEEVLVGPIPVGINKFVLQAKAPDHTIISNNDLLEVTVILVTCSYVDQEFVRIGYYVNNEYSEPFDPISPPNPVDVNKLFRNIRSDEPRVTRFPIDWSGNAPVAPPIESGAEGEIPIDENEDIVDFEKMDGDEMNEEEESQNDDEEEEEEEESDPNAEVDLEEEDSNDEEEDSTAEDDEAPGDLMQDDHPAHLGSSLPLNEDSMDVAMMQQYTDHQMSNQGLF